MTQVDQYHVVLNTLCRDRLAAYKVLRIVEILDDLPKTTTGKISRASLRPANAVKGATTAPQPPS